VGLGPEKGHGAGIGDIADIHGLDSEGVDFNDCFQWPRQFKVKTGVKGIALVDQPPQSFSDTLLGGSDSG